MLNRLLVLAGSVVAAATVAALPAVMGLSGNPSFSHQLPVHVPSRARAVSLVDGAPSVSVAPAPAPTGSRVIEAGDDGPPGGASDDNATGPESPGSESGGSGNSGPAGPTAVRSPDSGHGGTSTGDGSSSTSTSGGGSTGDSGATSSPTTTTSTSGGGGSGSGRSASTSSTPHDAPTGGSTSDSRHGGDGTDHA